MGLGATMGRDGGRDGGSDNGNGSGSGKGKGNGTKSYDTPTAFNLRATSTAREGPVSDNHQSSCWLKGRRYSLYAVCRAPCAARRTLDTGLCWLLPKTRHDMEFISIISVPRQGKSTGTRRERREGAAPVDAVKLIKSPRAANGAHGAHGMGLDGIVTMPGLSLEVPHVPAHALWSSAAQCFS